MTGVPYRVIFNCQIKGIGKMSKAISVTMFGMATPKKYMIFGMQVLALVFSQNPSIGEQEKIPTKTVAINQAPSMHASINKGIFVAETWNMRR